MKVKVKKLTPAAVIPTKAHKSDFCYDVVATSCEEIAPNVYRYGTGLAMQIERDTKDETINFCITARPRSSVWKTGMVLSNCEGTIDEGYTGEIMAVFYHVIPNMPKYNVGDKIFQMHIETTTPIQFTEADELSETDRGEGGYGSTGR
jgi:deoxyuridine 5'-triphosphate nucleotidohydrolase